MTTSNRLPAACERPQPTPDRGPLGRSAKLFEAGVLELLLVEKPESAELLAALGQVWAELGRREDGLLVDQRLVGLRPEDPVCRYNLACSLCRLGRLDDACAALLAALDLGFTDAAHLLQDDDLAALRDDIRFGLVRDRLATLGRSD